MKLALIGGGSVRTFYLMQSLLKFYDRLQITELSVMDNHPQKLEIFGGFAAYMTQKCGAHLRVSLTDNLREAVTDADYVITTIRVGMDKMRCSDERIALSHGLIGQETTGAGGYSYACRTIPAMLHICETIRRFAHKNVIIFNFTNPSGLITQAMWDAGYPVIGICDNATGIQRDLGDALHVGADELLIRVYGLNHLSWADQVVIDGRNILPDLMRQDAFVENFHQFAYFDRQLIRHLGKIPNGYLYYYYHREQALQNILSSPLSRGEAIDRINEKMMAELSRMDIRTQPEEMLAVYHRHMHEREGSYMQMETGGIRAQAAIDVRALGITELMDRPCSREIYEGYAGVSFNYMESIAQNKPIHLVLSVPNQGAIHGLQDDDVVEITCLVDQDGAHPLPIGDIPEDEYLLTRTIKRYEKLTIAAVRERSLDLGTQALMQHPLVGSYSLARSLVKEYAALNAPYCGEWT